MYQGNWCRNLEVCLHAKSGTLFNVSGGANNTLVAALTESYSWVSQPKIANGNIYIDIAAAWSQTA